MDTTGKSPTIRLSSARKELLSTYAEAAACLYGVLDISEFDDVFNHNEDAETDENEAILALQRVEKAKPDEIEYSLYGEFITGPTLHPADFEEDIEALHFIRIEKAKKQRYLPPSKDEFLKYSDALYQEPSQAYADLKAYIVKNNLMAETERPENQGSPGKYHCINYDLESGDCRSSSIQVHDSN